MAAIGITGQLISAFAEQGHRIYKTFNTRYMETIKTSPFRLEQSVEYAGQSTVSKMLIKKQTGNITLFAFDTGQSLSEHSAPFDAFVQVTEGRGRILINRQPYDLSVGDCIIMPADIPHAVQAIERFKMMLVMIRG